MREEGIIYRMCEKGIMYRMREKGIKCKMRNQLHHIIEYGSILHHIIKYSSTPQYAAICRTALLNTAVCRTLVDTIRYTLECAECAFWPPNAAKCCKNAGKFFPDELEDISKELTL